MMVVGRINGQKIREGHWTSKAENKNNRLLLKLDEQPSFATAEISLKYGTSYIPVTVKFLEWDDRYNNALVEIVSGY